MLSSEKNLQRRITQTLKAKPQTFFAVCRPAFEAISADEIEKLIQIKPTQTAVGGLEFSCKQEALWKLHLQALTLNSIRMRIASFRAGTLGELACKIKNIDWELYLYPGSLIEMESHFSHCRIEDAPLATAIAKREIEKALKHAESDSKETHPLQSSQQPQRIHLLGENNHYTLSIDCSGRRFFARGYRPYITEAPLRETTAASLLLTAKANHYQRLFLPMCGSGTFLLEAVSHYARELKAFIPSLFRPFPFMQTPSFRPATYEYLKKELFNQKRIIPTDWKLQAILASDINPLAIKATQQNLSKLLSQLACTPTEAESLLPTLSITQSDFFDVSWWKKERPTPSDLILFNPPYGKRLSTGNAFYQKIATLLKGELQEIPVAIIVPQEQKRWLNLKWKEEIPFFNGNIRCLFLMR